MIVRMWHGRVPTSKADAYRAFTNGRAIPDYRSVPGNLSVHVLERREGEVTHFITLTFWESLEAIRAFAGDDLEKAKYYPEDDGFLLEFEPRVVHYEVVGKVLKSAHRVLLLVVVAAAAIGGMALLPPIPQNPAYDRFADGRTLLRSSEFLERGQQPRVPVCGRARSGAIRAGSPRRISRLTTGYFRPQLRWSRLARPGFTCRHRIPLSYGIACR